MEVNFKIKGLKRLNTELKKLPEDFRTKALNGAVLAATKYVKEEAVLVVPKKSGNLASAIIAGRATGKNKSHSIWLSKYQVKVKKKGKDGSTWYARLVEDGHKDRAGKWVGAQSFMRVAYDRRKKGAVIIFGNSLKKKIAFYNKKIQRLQK